MLSNNNSQKFPVVSLLIFGFAGTPVFAEQMDVYQWQIKRLMQPSAKALSQEKQSHQVFIYENLRIEDVERALTANFDRIENMMFVGTILPPTSAGGEPQKEQDGCE